MNITWYWSLTVALAGFLFGFDTVVISGANAPIKELWQTSAWFHGVFIMSMALWGTVLGSLAGGIPTKKYGRKKTLIWVGVLYLVSALGSGLATDPYMFSFFRFLGGVGVGASTVAAPTYISEISTAKSRGRLVALYQFNIVFGILIAFISNYLLDGVGGSSDWRWMLGVEAIPAALYCLLILGCLIRHVGSWLSAVMILVLSKRFNCCMATKRPPNQNWTPLKLTKMRKKRAAMSSAANTTRASFSPFYLRSLTN